MMQSPPFRAIPAPLPADLQSQVDKIVAAVATTYGMTVAQMVAPGRDPLAVEARRITIQLLADKGLGAIEIGRQMARDHSTCLHHLSVLRDKPTEDEREMLKDLRKEVQKIGAG